MFTGRINTQTKMAEYENVCRGSLKLKGVSDHKIKKKKKKKDKDKELSKMYENIASHASTSSDEPTKPRKDNRTPAEIAFEKSKEKKMAQQILERASKTHKERIMDFNQHLDNLTEHFDIPKVSWTK